MPSFTMSHWPCLVWVLRDIFKNNEWIEIDMNKLLRTVRRDFETPCEQALNYLVVSRNPWSTHNIYKHVWVFMMEQNYKASSRKLIVPSVTTIYIYDLYHANWVNQVMYRLEDALYLKGEDQCLIFFYTV